MASKAVGRTPQTDRHWECDGALGEHQVRLVYAMLPHPIEDFDQLEAYGPGKAYMFAKRTFDVLFSLVLISTILPVLLVTAILIRLSSPGPAIFRQVRVGKGGRHFMLYKFRTMRNDSRATIMMFRDDDGHVHHKIRNDARVTSVGRLLRRTSIDELPQLINIIKGDMSLIGPRPELAEIVARYEPWQHDRHVVRPGLTGWWQVSGRGDLPMDENTELDLFYVRHQSFSMDLRIALKTIRVVLRGSGAY